LEGLEKFETGIVPFTWNDALYINPVHIDDWFTRELLGSTASYLCRGNVDQGELQLFVLWGCQKILANHSLSTVPRQ